MKYFRHEKKVLTIEIVMFLTYALRTSEHACDIQGQFFQVFRINGKFFEGVGVEFVQLAYYAN